MMKILLLVSLFGSSIAFLKAQEKFAHPCAEVPANSLCYTAVQNTCNSPESFTLLIPSLGSILPDSQQAADLKIVFTRTSQTLPRPTRAVLAPLDGDCSGFAAADGVAVANGASDDDFQIGALDNPAWAGTDLELEEPPRALCFYRAGNGGWSFSGFLWNVVWSCGSNTDTNVELKCPSWGSNFDRNPAYPNTLRQVTSPEKRAGLVARGVCCTAGQATLSSAPLKPKLSVGQCINPNTHSCCGSALYSVKNSKCCNLVTEAIVPLFRGAGQPTCPCKCKIGTLCPTGEDCCLPKKYSELNLKINDINPDGQCFNTKTQRCCDTGEMYNPGSHQCCSINGIQTLASQCPCSSNEDCKGGQLDGAGLPTQPTGQACCKQTAPPLFEAQDLCSAYANYPDGGRNGPNKARCSGLCIDPRFQICCNGNTCVKEYDRCCNRTCCNKFIASCNEGYLSPEKLPNWARGFVGSDVPNQPSLRDTPGSHNAPSENPIFTNPNELYVKYYTCSEIEQLDTIKSWWIYVLPTYLLLGTFISLTIVLVYASKVSTRAYDAIDRAVIALAILSIIFAIPLFFAPVYKYGVVVVVVALFAVLAPAARLKWLNIVLVFLQVLTLLYLFDPFHGNAYVTLASNRHAWNTNNGVVPNPNGALEVGFPDRQSAGILHATGMMWNDRETGDRNLQNLKTGHTCFQYYRYFRLDKDLLDRVRLDNEKVISFGYCDRAWITALLIFEGVLMIVVILEFVLSVIALILRFREDKSYDPIELEVKKQ